MSDSNTVEPKIAVVIPCYNEGQVIASVIRDVRAIGNYTIIVVDDGSSDGTYEQIIDEDIVALRHKINRGKGAAVKTGIAAANLLSVDVVVTMDGDGQHDPAEIAQLIKPIISGDSDVVLGSRVLDRDEMPARKKIANKIGNLITWLFYGILVSDSQSGFRAYSRYAALIIDARADKYEYDSKIIREIKHNRLRFCEVPVRTIYTTYSAEKKNKQGFINGLVTVYRMIWNFIA